MIHPNSVAVLPFTNMSKDVDNEYFSDGITEEIINVLAQVKGIQVTARTSSFAFKNQSMDVREIGDKLGVAHVLEGSIRRAGNRVRITAQLINTQQGFHEFSEVYDRDLEDVFAIQDEIALLITEKLKAELSRGTSMPFSNSHPKNTQAYDWYLQANKILYNGLPQDVNKAEELYKKVVDIEPDYALGYSGLAKCYLYYGAIQSMDKKAAFDQVEVYINKAFEIDPQLIDGHITYLGYMFWQNWNIPLALEHLAKTIQQLPGSAELHVGRAMILLIDEQYEEAKASMRLALQLDPFSVHVRHRAGVLLYCTEQYAEAIEQFKHEANNSVRNDTDFKIAWCQIFQKQYDEALHILNTVAEHPHQVIAHEVAKAYLYLQKGEITLAKEWIDTALNRLKTSQVPFPDYNLAILYMLLQNEEKMWDHLEKTLESQVPVALFTKVDPLWKPIANKPRFLELINRYMYSNIVNIKTNTQEEFTINLPQVLYIEAEDNYCQIVYEDTKYKLAKKLLRVSLKDLEPQIQEDSFVRTHRSFIINFQKKWQLIGKSKHYRFKNQAFEVEVPLSRSKEKEVLSQFKSLGLFTK
ncbi:hypothetical protein BKI52_26975 [marine bacterium AO1-C]|nr:hypothetical protein BKI52_26975 [marine bacterium AO1-C]